MQYMVVRASLCPGRDTQKESMEIPESNIVAFAGPTSHMALTESSLAHMALFPESSLALQPLGLIIASQLHA